MLIYGAHVDVRKDYVLYRTAIGGAGRVRHIELSLALIRRAIWTALCALSRARRSLPAQKNDAATDAFASVDRVNHRQVLGSRHYITRPDYESRML